jgi:hypothetical protein
MLAVPAIALGVLLSAGCGGKTAGSGIASASGAGAGNSAAPSPTPSVDRQQQVLNFARCMRAHGVNMADPIVSDGNISIQMPRNTDKQKADAAQQACKQYLPNGGVPPTLSPQQLEQARKYAQCMRQHGVDMPDPDPNNGGLRVRNGDPNDPRFQAAEQACQSLQPRKK